MMSRLQDWDIRDLGGRCFKKDTKIKEFDQLGFRNTYRILYLFFSEI